MAMTTVLRKLSFIFSIVTLLFHKKCSANDILGCGGFVKSHVNLDFSKIEIGLYTKEGSLKERTECAPTNGYYFLPLYEKGNYVLKVHPPPGWSFEPSQVDLIVDGESDPCSRGQDVNFAFNGFGITGKVITAGQNVGPSGISVQLIDDNGSKRNTVTTSGGNFHFTPVIPGKYTLKASHPKWKLEPGEAVVQVKEGNTALPVGVLAVKGYDVKGTVTAYGSPIGGIYVLLYAKEDPKFRVEGCNTALLQGVPDSPICHSITDSNGEFTFGLVPAGEYKLLALSKSPGQAAIVYNLKKDEIAFSVAHDSLFIKNAFEVSGFTVIGSVLTSPGGAGIKGVRVLLDGNALGTTDGAGKFTLPSLQPGTYTLTFKHEECELPEIQYKVDKTGPAGPATAVATRWRVCGAVVPAAGRSVAFSDGQGNRVASVTVQGDKEGKWCTFLPVGVYNAKVEVSEQEYRDGLQFYPVSQKVSVGHAPVSGITFSQLKGTVRGRVVCAAPACKGLTVTLRPLTTDGGYVGKPLTTTVENGEYKFESILPGSLEVSVWGGGLCWAEGAHTAHLAAHTLALADFVHTGYELTITSKYNVQVQYTSNSSKGELSVPAGRSAHCLPHAEEYTFTPTGCHQFRPPQFTVNMAADEEHAIELIAVSHAAVIRIESPRPAEDVTLHVVRGADTATATATATHALGPLVPLTLTSGGYYYEHTLYLAEGEKVEVWSSSSSLVMEGGERIEVLGSGQCAAPAALIRTRPATTIAGRVVPPVHGVVLTLTTTDMQTLTYITKEDGAYTFGPLDASLEYELTAEKESYVFGERDKDGNIAAHKLAEITVEVIDDADGKPLQGALVSVSGGSYRRNAATPPSGLLRLAALSPHTYYVKPHMKEYKFVPPSHTVNVLEGKTHHLQLRGVRIAWSCVGRVVSLGGVGWGGVAVTAVAHTHTHPQSHSHPHSADRCATQEATTDQDGAFRIRGLLPNCVYGLELKVSAQNSPELKGLKIAKAPASLEIKDKQDIEDVVIIAVQPAQVTDGAVWVRAAQVDHYRTLRLSLAPDSDQNNPIYTTKLEAVGYSAVLNPGLMYTLPRLPADNATYILTLESTLSKATHVYKEEVIYFNSDGKFKHFTIEFNPKVKTSEQELRQSSLLLVPLVAIIGVCYLQREALLGALSGAGGAFNRAPAPRRHRPPHEVLDKASIDHIVSAVNAAGKKTSKKKAQ